MGFQPKSFKIHYNGSLHWVTSTRACKDEFVYIYDSYSVIDSSGRPRLAASLQLQIAQIYHCASNEMPILLPEMSRQCNGVDCGLYAIATATDLCFGNNPAERNYDQSQMRAHLLKCILQQHLDPFPATSISRTNVLYYGLTVYCYCRKPADDNMIECVLSRFFSLPLHFLQRR